MNNKNGTAMITKSILLLLIVLFYACVFLFYGLVFGNTTDLNVSSRGLSGTTFSWNNIITGILNVPLWINAIIFSPLVVAGIFLIVTSLPTFNGGS